MSAARDLDAVFREQIDAIVRAVRAAHADPAKGPVVTELRYTLDRDWSGDDAIHFTGILRDPVGREFYELEETSPIREQVYDLVRESSTERIPYLTFQLESERRALDAAPDGDDDNNDDSP
jgi:hypothetical protein